MSVAPRAVADTVLHIDLNNFTVTRLADPTAGVRAFSLSLNTSTVIKSTEINGVELSLGDNIPDLLSGTIFVDTNLGQNTYGAVTGNLRLQDDDSNEYSIASMNGKYSTTAGQVKFEAFTFGGLFSFTTPSYFDDVDVSAFAAVQPVSGNLLQFDLATGSTGPNKAWDLIGGADKTVNAEIYAVVPLPPAIWAGVSLMGLMGIKGFRRQRLLNAGA